MSKRIIVTITALLLICLCFPGCSLMTPKTQDDIIIYLRENGYIDNAWTEYMRITNSLSPLPAISSYDVVFLKEESNTYAAVNIKKLKNADAKKYLLTIHEDVDLNKVMISDNVEDYSVEVPENDNPTTITIEYKKKFGFKKSLQKIS